MRRHAVAFLVVLAVTASIAVRERRVAKALEASTRVEHVDMGVTLHVVRQSPDGRKVRRATPENVIRTHHLGGMVAIDALGTRYAGPSLRPVEWLCSEAQEPLILHDEGRPLWSLIQGSEGAGKSVALVMWTALRVLENVGRNVTGAITVPTTPRFRAVKKEIAKIWPAHWWRWRERDHAYVFHVGPTVQIVSAVQRSEASGSPLQGDSLEWCASDELQDHFSLEADIMSRGRGSDRYLRLCTSTSKDYSEWRTYRDTVRASSEWTFTKLIGMESPFVDRDFWQRIRRSGTVTEREWRRRYEAADVGPERQVYFNWRRTFDNGNAANLRAIPDGARDVTAEILAPWLGNASVLVGHDPGERQQVSVLLKAFILPGQRKGDDRPRWFVVDEITSPESTIHAHAQQVLARLRSHWHCHAPGRDGRPDPSSPVALVRIDPHTRGGEGHPGSDVATIWKALGMVARAAAYKAASVEPVTIKRRQRIDLVNTLLSATADVGEVRRLFVATRSGFLWPEAERDGKPAAPQLVKAFETMEFNEAGQAERERKDADDLSHWPAALGYALWNVEAPRLGWKAEAA